MNTKENGDSPLYREAEAALQNLREMLSASHPEALKSARSLTNLLISRDRSLVLYLGAGCSVSVHERPPTGVGPVKGKTWQGLLRGLFDAVPDKDRFLETLAKRVGTEFKKTNGQGLKFEDFFNVFDRLQLAWFLTEAFDSRKSRDDEIAKLVEPHPNSECHSELYEALLDLPFNDIVTTNYDSNIVRFLKNKGYVELVDRTGVAPTSRGYVEITNSRSIATTSKGEGCSRIFYLHGKVGGSGPFKPELVFDRFDYAKLLTERDGIIDYVTFLLRDSHIIYVGSGLDDPTFNQMETRLQNLHGEDRPQSFALLINVTEKERQVWQKRNLEIIDYNRFDDPPKIISWINTIQKFVRRAEPDRPKRLIPNADRTRGYWENALKSYFRGDYEESLRNCRAALASTLFWEREPVDTSNKKALPFDRAAILCEIRIRMGHNHYKLNGVKESPPDHKTLMDENIAAATGIIASQQQRTNLSETQKRVLRGLENSLMILKARANYRGGEFKAALNCYDHVISRVPKDFLKFNPDDQDRESIITALRLAEGYYYARCQRSRLDYQSIDRHVDNRPEGRANQVGEMLQVESELAKICDFLKAKETTCRRFPEWAQFQNSLWIIRRISMWTAGRHAVRVCRDLIPTKDERTIERYDELSKGLEFLGHELPDGCSELSQSGDQEWTASPRWPALRLRYQCRGFALRWIVGLEKGQADEDIVKANNAIQRAFEQTKGQGLERQQSVNLLEAARLHVLAIFGERLRNAGRVNAASPLALAAGLHYLDDAFKHLHEMPDGTSDKWLLALGHRVASYFALVAGPALRIGVNEIKDDRLASFLKKDLQSMAEEVENQYRHFAKMFGDEKSFDKRIDYYRTTFDHIKSELNEPYSLGAKSGMA